MTKLIKQSWLSSTKLFHIGGSSRRLPQASIVAFLDAIDSLENMLASRLDDVPGGRVIMTKLRKLVKASEVQTNHMHGRKLEN